MNLAHNAACVYGTMNDGGSKWEGVVFKLSRDSTGYRALHNFTGYRGGEDGSWPQGVLEGSDGVLYGTTQVGGLPGGDFYPTGSGTVFKVNKDGTGYAVLHRFPAIAGDGIAPWAGLVEGLAGALYGTTLEGGAGNIGTVFRLNKDGTGYAVLHSFQNNDTDGFKPMAALLVGSDGSLYGTTDGGGTTSGRNGTVFTLSPAKRGCFAARTRRGMFDERALTMSSLPRKRVRQAPAEVNEPTVADPELGRNS